MQFVASYAVLNLYVYVMAYMYSPCGQALPSNNILMGESDEEVLYGDLEARDGNLWVVDKVKSWVNNLTRL